MHHMQTKKKHERPAILRHSIFFKRLTPDSSYPLRSPDPFLQGHDSASHAKPEKTRANRRLSFLCFLKPSHPGQLLPPHVAKTPHLQGPYAVHQHQPRKKTQRTGDSIPFIFSNRLTPDSSYPLRSPGLPICKAHVPSAHMQNQKKNEPAGDLMPSHFSKPSHARRGRHRLQRRRTPSLTAISSAIDYPRPNSFMARRSAIGADGDQKDSSRLSVHRVPTAIEHRTRWPRSAGVGRDIAKSRGAAV